jgi:hypothetical protein
MKPKEDPADRAARLRERRMSELDQMRAGEANAASLTSDLKSTYNFSRGLFANIRPSVFTKTPVAPPKTGPMIGGK